MVNFSTIAIIGGLGLLIFFQKDVGKFLDQFKGFGENFGAVNLPDINISIPSFGIPEAFAETGEAVGQAGAGIVGALTEVGSNIEQAGIGAREVIFQAGVEAREGFDQSIKETQQNFEQFGKDVQTNIGIIGAGITEFVGGIFPDPKTIISEKAPSIVTTSRRSGTSTRFGGQTVPKEILTQQTATTPKIIVAQQPDLSLVSPFLTQFQNVQKTDPVNEPAKAVTRTGRATRFS